MDKYELQPNETYLSEYTEDDGTHVTIILDENGNKKHGFVLELERDVHDKLIEAATEAGVTPNDYIEAAIETMMKNEN